MIDDEVNKTEVSNGGIKGFFFDWIMPVLIAFVIVFLINKFIFFQVQVPTGSMIPTIQKKDRLFVTKVYDYSSIKRGDILVFISRENNDEWFVKRVVGLPGEHVVIDENGTVFINGEMLQEDYVENPSPKQADFTVPEGKYLMLGDNRAVSDDARYWKNPYIDEKDILGKARITVFPFNRFGSLK